MKKTISLLAFLACLSSGFSQDLHFSNKTDQPTARGASSSASDGTYAYIANGFSTTSQTTTEIERYHFNTNTWSVMPTAIPTISKVYGNMEYLANALYLFNGITANGSRNDKLEIIELSTGNVTVNSTLNPNPVSAAGSAVCGDNFISFGGCIDKFNAQYSNKTYRLSPFGIWTALADMPVALEAKGKVVYGNGSNSKLYVIGGYNETNSLAENFSTTVTGQPLALSNWINVAETGTKTFRGNTFNGNKYAEITAFQSAPENQEPVNKAWLISDAITALPSDNLILNFDTKDGYNNGATFEAYLITNWTGDILTSTKTLLNATIASGATVGYATYFTNSGNIPLTGFTNSFRIAFKYSGGYTPLATTTYQVDNVRIYKSFTSDSIYIYDFASNTWTASTVALPQPLSACALAFNESLSSDIYVTGDYDNQTFTGVYHTTTNTFTSLNQYDMVGRRHHNSEIWNNNLYIFGGNKNSSISSSLSSVQSAELPVLYEDGFNTTSEFLFYPNPATENIRLDAETVSATIYAIDGKKMDTRFSESGIDISKLASGIYIVEATSKNGVILKKKLIKK